MKSRSTLAVLLSLALGLTSCASVQVERYRDERPALDLRTYLNGTLDAWGMFQGRSGEVQRRFHVVIDARWDGDKGELDENFTWSDGGTSRRVWTLTRQGDGSYRGWADDVVGEAIGEVAGNALHWRYTLALPADGKVYQVDFDDWMFLMDERVMLNRATMSKWGWRLGEVTLSFAKR
jgi:hypothetical protein